MEIPSGGRGNTVSPSNDKTNTEKLERKPGVNREHSWVEKPERCPGETLACRM